MSTLPKNKTPEGLKALVHLGLISAPEAREASGANFSMECPFCSGTNSFGVALQQAERNGKSISPGMWNCFRCGEHGNTASLLQKVYALAKNTPTDLTLLSNDRGLPADLLEEYGIVQALYTSQWWVPVFNEEDVLINIYRYDISLKQEKSPYAFIGCPGMSAGLFNVQTLRKPPPGCDLPAKELNAKRSTYSLKLDEGHWDTIALDHILREAGVRATCDLVGLPGANSFQEAWLRHLHARPVELFLDYDPPKEINGKIIQAGGDGTQRIIKMIRGSSEFKPTSVSFMEWKV